MNQTHNAATPSHLSPVACACVIEDHDISCKRVLPTPENAVAMQSMPFIACLEEYDELVVEQQGQATM